jgi:hypothetical protein
VIPLGDISMQNEPRQYIQPSPSEVFPDFPLNPQNLSYEGAPIKGELLINALNVALCFLDECESLKGRASRNWLGQPKWPGGADKEIARLRSGLTNGQMGRQVAGARPTIKNLPEIHRIAASYLDRLRNDSAEYEEFMAERLSVYYLMLDFAHTLGCSGVIQTALEWWGR